MDPGRRRLLIAGAVVATMVGGGLLPTACAIRRMKEKGNPGVTAPRRPAGEPKPALVEDIGPVLARLDRWYAAHLPAGAPYAFNPPASDARIDAFERQIGIALPASYRQLYRWHDGEEDSRWGHLYGLPILSLGSVAAEWAAWQRVIEEFGGNRYMLPAASFPAGAIDPAYSNPRWIPLSIDGSGGCIGLDFDPWPGGRIGQVILYGRDEDVKVVLAPSLGGFLDWIADLLESGNFRLDAEGDRPRLRLFRLKDPAVDHFLEGARKMLGAPGPFLPAG